MRGEAPSLFGRLDAAAERGAAAERARIITWLRARANARNDRWDNGWGERALREAANAIERGEVR